MFGPESFIQESERNQEIFERVTENSKAFDARTAELAKSETLENSEKSFEMREWKIGDTVITAIGISHVPETFLSHREKIELAIEGSDIVVNEFAPEALGFYNKDLSKQLASKKSDIDPNYNLEELRQGYIEYEETGRPNLGLFHHEIELLTAKYGKDMACIDLAISQDVDKALQDSFFFLGFEGAEEKKTKMKRMGVLSGGTALTVAGLSAFLSSKNNEAGDSKMPATKTKLSRRKFLGAMTVLVGATVATAGPDFIKPREVPQKISRSGNVDDMEREMNMCRDPQLAKGLAELAKNGSYKKIAFIYGINHIDSVERCILDPEESIKKVGSPENQNSIFGRVSKFYPGSVKIFRLAPGQNNSDRFVASENMVWERINKK